MNQRAYKLRLHQSFVASYQHPSRLRSFISCVQVGEAAGSDAQEDKKGIDKQSAGRRHCSMRELAVRVIMFTLTCSAWRLTCDC